MKRHATPTVVRHACLAILAAALGPALARGAVLDEVRFGDDASETAHALKPTDKSVITGGLGDRARALLPPKAADWRGGTLAFDVKIDPARANYVTTRLWGEDVSEDVLILYADGRQIGYRHLGDIDVLDVGTAAPALRGRFFYRTLPLPIDLTRGRSTIHLEIRSTGRISGYAQTFEDYQKPMTAPTRGIYRVFTHADSCFAPPADEPMGKMPAGPPVRTSPGADVLATVKDRVAREVRGLLDAKSPLNQHQLWFLARAAHVAWTPAHDNAATARRATEALDALYVAYMKDPTLAQAGPAIYNGDWFGLGPAASAASLLADALAPALDQPIAGASATKRRAGWAEMFVASRDWHRRNRRQYTNQSMINDTFGIYWCNRAVAAIDPSRALPEAAARRYLYESAGLEPWLGSEDASGKPQRPLGEDYLQLTAKGLTKELGFVGYYGEVLDWMTTMYDATRPRPGEPGDARLRGQLVKAAAARAPFRYPDVDGEGFRAMRAEAVVGWRDAGHYPGDVLYAQRATWDASTIEAAAATLDPALVAGVRQMLAEISSSRASPGNSRPAACGRRRGCSRCPTTTRRSSRSPRPPRCSRWRAGRGDFAFADEEDGVIAVRRGDEVLYASLYWRARYGINGLACVHDVTPQFDRLGVVRAEVKFTPSEMTYTRPYWTNFGFGNGGMRYPGDIHSAHAGEQLPIARIPAGIRFKPGDESVYAGKADFYTLRYGRYLIGMNSSANQSFDLAVPAGRKPRGS